MEEMQVWKNHFHSVKGNYKQTKKIGKNHYVGQLKNGKM